MKDYLIGHIDGQNIIINIESFEFLIKIIETYSLILSHENEDEISIRMRNSDLVSKFIKECQDLLTPPSIKELMIKKEKEREKENGK